MLTPCVCVGGGGAKRSRAGNSTISDGIWPVFEIIRDIMVVIVTCKNEKDPFKNVGARVLTKYSPIIILLELYVAMETRVPILPAFKPNADNPPPE